MKKILLAVEYVGKEGFEESDQKLVDCVRRYKDGSEMHLLCKDLIMNEAGDYVRMKGVEIHTSLGVNLLVDANFDEIMAFDEWGTNAVRHLSQNADVQEDVEVKEPMKHEYDARGEKMADIIIPHHDRHDHLKECLDRLPNSKFNIIVVSGKTFGENCNKGAKLAETDNIFFVNDDTLPDLELIEEACEKKADIVGFSQIIPSLDNDVRYGVVLFDEEGNLKPQFTKDRSTLSIPNGFFLRIKRKAWDDLGGFDEKFKNGGEDTDLFLRALEMKMTIDYIYKPTIHKHSQSQDRLKFSAENNAYLNEKWPEEKIKEVLGEKRNRVLIATNHLDRLGGTETWTYTMAKEFERRGWLVEVFTLQNGELADKLPVVEKPTGEYDLVIINHNSCLRALSDVRGKKIFTSHGIYPQLEQPESGADEYVAISEEVKKHMKELGFKATIIRNGVDCERFKPKKKIPAKAKRVLSLCHGEEANENIKKACEEMGLEFDDIGGNRIFEIEEKINNADIVVTLGRGAYESMACGRAVMVYDSRKYSPFKTGDGMVTEKNVDQISENNFSGRKFKIKMTVADIKREFKKYKPTMGEFNRKYALANFNIKKQAEKYIKL